MAGLDKRLAVEVDRSAAVVVAGRRNLDAVKQWVVDAASTVPKTAAGERMLWPVISKGSSEIADSHPAFARRDVCHRRADARPPQRVRRNRQCRRSSDRATEHQGRRREERRPARNDARPQRHRATAAVRSERSQHVWARRLQGARAGIRNLGARPVQPRLSTQSCRSATGSQRHRAARAVRPNDRSTYGPSGYKELVPGLGAWVPDPSSPTFPKGPRKRQWTSTTSCFAVQTVSACPGRRNSYATRAFGCPTPTTATQMTAVY